jgi:hypothetical protein
MHHFRMTWCGIQELYIIVTYRMTWCDIMKPYMSVTWWSSPRQSGCVKLTDNKLKLAHLWIVYPSQVLWMHRPIAWRCRAGGTRRLTW